MSRLFRPSLAVGGARSRLLMRTTPPRRRQASSFLQNSPSPPRLPADQQAEFERLQRAAEAALSSHTNSIPPATGQPESAPLLSTSVSRHPSMPSASSQAEPFQTQGVGGGASAGTFSGGIRQGAPPEFEGDKNPRTGEVGGPKNEPLRWGGEGDWSYNGRVTDF
ncbi:hypothetical protein C8A03DRAFT_36715 [Achaetomium macrosporum]|uniref:Succinate dehydrogenase assembly factor 4, mitochondrial n=1 Tax=Achaetomium macrosporum TaxID=79813 RepID=A0AAN7C6R6_9PEZI|nr:hypothetical protein C8A03DRAFT_36715 [Achaetomium macrosporum]